MSMRVLIVDDMKDMVASLSMLLQAWGYDVHTAFDGEAALQAADSFRPRAVLLDIGLPILNGYEVARRLRQAFGDTVVIICLTGYGTDEDRRQAHAAGANHHLVKPADPEVLHQLLAACHEPQAHGDRK